MSLLKYFSPVKNATSVAVRSAAMLPSANKRTRDGEDVSIAGSGDKRSRADETAKTASESSSLEVSIPEPDFASAGQGSASSAPAENSTLASIVSPITEAQVARIEANRLAALERRKQAEQKQNAAADPNSVSFANLEQLFVCESWRKLLHNEFSKPYFAALKRFLVQEQKEKKQIFPPIPKIFHAFDVCPVENVKVVIIGQDPYHDDGQAEGLCFSVPVGQRIPSSLQNIYKELGDCIPGFKRPSHGHLGAWGAQGVFLLNTGLTVRAHEANSHNNKGWQTFTDAVIAQLSSKREGLVFFLWGKHAQDKEKLINKSKRHTVFKCAHPSGLSAKRGFFGCKHFALANEALVKQALTPIDWQI